MPTMRNNDFSSIILGLIVGIINWLIVKPIYFINWAIKKVFIDISKNIYTKIIGVVALLILAFLYKTFSN